MNATEYKIFHESFMKNNNGTTPLEIMSVIAPTSLTTFLTLIIYIIAQEPMSTVYKFFIEFVIIVLPIVLSVTILSNTLYQLGCTLLVIAIPIVLKLTLDIYSNLKLSDIFSIEIPTVKREFISNIRAMINIITSVCILAVDFQTFPRRFAKTESYGFGLMDTGVGLYVFGNGIIAPEIYKKDSSSFKQHLRSQCINSIPLMILGIGRFIIVKEIDYQEHISEYGVHWNFFITLAITKLLGTMLLRIIPEHKLLVFALLVSVVQEMLLYCGLSNWVLSNIDRDNFFNANREGMTSVLGYVALYLFSVHIGKQLYIKTGEMRTNISTLVRLACYAILLNALTFIYHNHFGVSRRLANFGYSMFVLSIAVTMSAIFLMMELFIIAHSKLSYKVRFNKLKHIPLIFQSINYNGLTFFLMANLGTGFINLSIRTMLVQPFYSVFIIILYMFVICGIATLLLAKEIRLKIW